MYAGWQQPYPPGSPATRSIRLVPTQARSRRQPRDIAVGHVHAQMHGTWRCADQPRCPSWPPRALGYRVRQWRRGNLTRTLPAGAVVAMDRLCEVVFPSREEAALWKHVAQPGAPLPPGPERLSTWNWRSIHGPRSWTAMRPNPPAGSNALASGATPYGTSAYHLG